jgi:molybdenum cofactor cytidylyltransferase
MDGIKQLLSWKDTVLINHAIRVAKETDVKRVAVVLGANAAKIREKIRSEHDGGTLLFENKFWEEGMGNSIAYGMGQLLKTENSLAGVLILLCDQPLMDAQYLGMLTRSLSTCGKGIIATRYGQRAGVPAIFSEAYFEALRQLNADRGARDLLEMNKADCLVMDAGERCKDIDTRQDYLELLSED